MRASRINGCAYCLDMHSKALRRNGQTDQHIYLLNCWHDFPLYTPGERWAGTWTRAAEGHASSAICDEVRKHFDDKEFVDLTILIGMINLWTGLAIGLQYVRTTDAAA